MKKITKRIVGLALTAGLALTVGAGVTALYSSYEDTTITASAADSVDLVSTVRMTDCGTMGDYADTPLYRILLTESDTAAWDFGRFCANEYGGEVLKWIKINGKSIYDHRAEYLAAVAAGERTAVTSKQPNINSPQDATNNYAPIFVNVVYHSSLSAKAIDIYVANEYMTRDEITSIEITTDFSSDYINTTTNTTATASYVLSKNVYWAIGGGIRTTKYEGGKPAYTATTTTVTAPVTPANENANFFSTKLGVSDYANTGENSLSNCTNVKLAADVLNFWNYIYLDGVSLNELISNITDKNTPSEIGYNVWGSSPSFSFRLSTFTKDYFNGLTEIKYLKGCQFPSYANPGATCYELAEDVTFVRYNGEWVNKANVKVAEDVTFSGGYISGAQSELVKFEISIADFAWTEDDRDAFDWNYNPGVPLRQSIKINGTSIYDIQTTVDDSSYVYSTSPMSNNGGQDATFSHPIILRGNIATTGNKMELWVHKDYLATLGDEVTITLSAGAQNWTKDSTLTEEASQVYYKYADGSYATTKMEETATEVTEVSTTKHGYNFITFTLSNLDFPADVEGLKIINNTESAKYSKVNFMSYIYVNGKPLSESQIGEVIYNLAGTNTISIRLIDYGQEGDANFDNKVFTAAINKIEIKAGCQFPAYGYAVDGGAVKAYTVASDMIWAYNGTAWETTEYMPMTIAEATAAEDGTKVRVSGTVCEVNTGWSDQYGNITVTIVDENGDKLYVYRMKTNVTLGDIIIVEGKMGTHNGRQIAAGSTAKITGHDSSYDYVEMTIEQALAAEDGVNVIITGTVVEIKTAYSESYGNISVDIADDNGTRLYLYRLSGNVEVGQIIKVKGVTATYKGNRQITGGTFEVVGTHTCANYTEATCEVPAKCVVCGTAKDDVLADHNYVDGACSVCGEAEPAPAYIEVYLQPGDNTIEMLAGQYAMAYMRGAGKFTFTWTGEASVMAGRLPIANGDVVDYNPMMGAFVIMPTDAEQACTVVLTVAEYVAPVVELQLGANAVNVTVESNYCAGTEVEFTATEAGDYVLKIAEGEENADVTYITDSVAEWIENYPYAFTLAEGETIKFLVCTSNVMLTEDTIDLVIEKAAPAYIEVTLNEGENSFTIGAGQYATSYVYAMGDYTFSWTGDVTITIGMNPAAIENGGVVTFSNPMFGQNTVTITPVNADAECAVVLTITAYTAPAVELQLGANAVNVTVENYYCTGTEVQFTATEAGDYVLKIAEGEENADVTYITDSVAEWIENYPYAFTLAEGETIKFLVCTSNVMLTEDTIDLVIEKAITEEPDDSSSDEPTSSEPTDDPADSNDEPTSSEPSTTEPQKEGGCGSVIGGVSAALTLVAAAAIVMKKKED